MVRGGTSGVRPEWHFRFCSKDLRRRRILSRRKPVTAVHRRVIFFVRRGGAYTLSDFRLPLRLLALLSLMGPCLSVERRRYRQPEKLRWGQTLWKVKLMLFILTGHRAIEFGKINGALLRQVTTIGPVDLLMASVVRFTT